MAASSNVVKALDDAQKALAEVDFNKGTSQALDSLKKAHFDRSAALRAYHQKHMAGPRTFSVLLRGLALVLTITALLWPTGVALLNWYKPDVMQTLWLLAGSGLLALAGFMVLVDQVMGFSQSWARHAATLQKLRAVEAQAAGEFFAATLGYKEQPSRKLLANGLEVLLDFGASVNAIDADETTLWRGDLHRQNEALQARLASAAAEYEANVNRAGEVRAAVRATGGLSISVEERKHVSGPLVVKVGGRTAELVNPGDVADFNFLDPGNYTIEISGQDDDGRSVRGLRLVDVVAGQREPVSLKLERTPLPEPKKADAL